VVFFIDEKLNFSKKNNWLLNNEILYLSVLKIDIK